VSTSTWSIAEVIVNQREDSDLVAANM